MHTTPPSLLEKLRQRSDQQAWDEFVRLYTPLFFRWVRPLRLREADAADLVQDVFVILVQKLPEFRYDPQKSFRAWLRTMLNNRWRNWYAARAARPECAAEGLPEFVDLDAESFEETEYRQYLVARALELMQSDFQPATWQACWKLVVDGRSGAEVAQELGLSVNAVYLAKARVLARLRQELAGLLE